MNTAESTGLWKIVDTLNPSGQSLCDWSIRRHNRTSGKGSYHIVASGLKEFTAKTFVNSANAGGFCWQYDVVDPGGQVWRNSNRGKDVPLRCQIIGDRLVIEIGVDTLAFADVERTGFKISNPREFAKDVSHEMLREKEDGATMLTDLLDEAMERALNNGSIHITATKEAL